MRHYIENNLVQYKNTINILLIGAGGTGSHVLSGLARIHHALMELEQRGLHVVVFDPDTISHANMGRQNFALADIHQSKASVLVSRMNQYFGLSWEAYPFSYPLTEELACSYGIEEDFDIAISCVDTARARYQILAHLKQNSIPYWLDFGNDKTSAQVVLGTLQEIKQPTSSHEVTPTLPTIIELFPNLLSLDDGNNTPSCSTREALAKQDLFVNATVANFGCSILWNVLRNGFLEHHGFFLDVASSTSSPLSINKATWQRFGYSA